MFFDPNFSWSLENCPSMCQKTASRPGVLAGSCQRHWSWRDASFLELHGPLREGLMDRRASQQWLRANHLNDGDAPHLWKGGWLVESPWNYDFRGEHKSNYDGANTRSFAVETYLRAWSCTLFKGACPCDGRVPPNTWIFFNKGKPQTPNHQRNLKLGCASQYISGWYDWLVSPSTGVITHISSAVQLGCTSKR